MRRATLALLLVAVAVVEALTNCPSTAQAGWDGQVFDLTFEPPAGMMVAVNSIDILRGASAAAGNIEFYRREGTAIGNEFNSDGWALEVSLNAGAPSVSLNIPYSAVFSKPSETVGFYLTGDSAQGNPSWIHYGPTQELEQSLSSGLILTAGEAVTYPFQNPNFGARFPNMCVNYVLAPLQACSGSLGSAGTPGLSFDVEVTPPSGYSVRLTSVSFNQAALSTGSTVFQLYIKEDTALGEEFTMTSWTAVDSTASIGPGALITLNFPLSTSFSDPTPKRMGVYITATAQGSWLDTGTPTTITSPDNIVSFFEGRPVIPLFGEPVVPVTRILSNACFDYEVTKLEACTSSGAGAWQGVAFDVIVSLPPNREIVLESVSLVRDSTDGLGASMEVWYNPNGGVANAFDQSTWVFLTSFPAGPANQAMEIPFEQVITTSSTIGLYVTGTSTGFWVDYYNPNGAADYTSADGIVTVVADGESVSYPFVDPGFSGFRTLSSSCLGYSVRSSLAVCNPSSSANWDGVSFDVDVNVGAAAVVLESITVERAQFNGGGNLLAYYNPAGASGNEFNSAGWTLISTVDGGGPASEVLVPLGIVVNADTTLGLYITGDSAQGGNPAWVYYVSTTGIVASDGTVTVYAGEGVTYPFTAAFSGRALSGACLSYSVVSPTPSVTPSVTPTMTTTPSNTATSSVTPSSTRTTTRTPSQTRTQTGTGTSSRTPTRTRTSSPSSTASNTPTRTQTPTPSNTRTPTRTPTVTNTGTSTTTMTPTSSQTRTPTGTVTMTGTASFSASGTGSVTASVSATSSSTNSPTASASLTATSTMSGSGTGSATVTASSTASGTSSVTSSLSAGASPLPTRTPTSTPSSTGSGTASPSPSTTESQSATVTPSETTSNTGSASASTSLSGTTSETASVTRTGSGTASPTATPSTSSTVSRSGTPTTTSTVTPSSLSTVSPTGTATTSLSMTPTSTLSAGATPSTTESASKTASVTATETSSSSSTPTPSPTGTASVSPTSSESPSSSVTPTRSGTATASETGTVTPSTSATVSAPVSPSSTRSGPPTVSSTRSTSASPTPFDASSQQFSASATPSNSRLPSALGPLVSPSPQASRSVIPFGGNGGGSSDEDDSGDGIVNGPAASSPTPSRSITPLLGSICVGCVEVEEVHQNLAMWYSSTTESDLIVVRSQDGEAVATISLNDGDVLPVDTNVNIVPVVDFPRFSVVSESVLDVTLTDSNGGEVDLVGDAELCFSVDANVDTEDLCLGFIDEDGQWKCEDSCLQQDNDFLCGTTDHFTSFALLLAGGENGGGDGCGSSDGGWDPLIAYLSIGIVGFFALIVIVAVILIETRFRYLSAASSMEFTKLSKRLATGQSAESASLATD